MSNAAASPSTDLKDTLEEMRASVAAHGARKGLRGAIQEAILGFLEVLLALLADFRAGRLAPTAPVAEDRACGGAVSVASANFRGEDTPPPIPRGQACGLAGLSRAADQRASGADGAAAYPLFSVSAGSHCAVRGGGPIKGRGIQGEPADCGGFAGSGDEAKGEETPAPGKPTLLRAAPRPRRFDIVACARSAAFAAVVGYARHSPCTPSLRGAVERADSKNGVFGRRDSADAIVPV
jgi:hypothetical protein